MSHDEDHDREVARVAYADMLHDHERNYLYCCAIEKTVKQLIDRIAGDVHVVDIGTGTGLLSMIAVRAGGGRVKVRAYESFGPVADCARRVIAGNGYSSDITVISGRGEDGRSDDSEDRADLLITELFDTELIGEAALPVYRSVLTNLCKNPVVAVPSKARIYVQLLKSKSLTEFHRFHPVRVCLKDGVTVTLTIPDRCSKCCGSNQLHDLQVDQLRLGTDFVPCSLPTVVFDFSFSDVTGVRPEEWIAKKIELTADTEFSELVVLFWWDLIMDEDGEYVLSTRPKFPATGEEDLQLAWREHWIQAIYYPTYERNQTKRKTDYLQLYCFHDDFSFQFSLDPDSDFGRVTCSCGIHCALSRSRLKVLNDHKMCGREVDWISNLMSRHDSSDDPVTSFLYIGSSSYLPLIVAKLFPTKPMNYLTDENCVTFFRQFSEANNLVLEPADISSLIMDETFLLMEPHCQFADLPTDLIHLFSKYGIDLRTIRPERSLINRAVVKCLPVQFNHLWKTRAPAGPEVLGFDITDFDLLIQTATTRVDCSVESYPLWEYPCRSLTETAILLFDLNWDQLTSPNATTHESVVRVSALIDSLPADGKHMAFCFWVEFYHWDQMIWSSGPTGSAGRGEYVKWPAGVRQGVALLHEEAARAANFCCTLRLRTHSPGTSADRLSSSSASLSFHPTL